MPRRKNIKISNGKSSKQEIEKIKQIIKYKKIRIDELNGEISVLKKQKPKGYRKEQ